MRSYQEMLKIAKEKLPKVQAKSERFEMPKIKGRVEGNKTIVVNMFQISDLIARKPEHILKYLQRELATAGQYVDKRLVFMRKLSSKMINEKLHKYIDLFVLCKECGKPDTKLADQKGNLVKKCLACGTKVQVVAKI
jgi:translation initiation factor 2 subunit 2